MCMNLKKSLSNEEQSALFCSLRELRLFASGLKSVAGFDVRSGDFISYQASPEIAEWAIPYATRIKEGEDLFQIGENEKAINKFKEILAELTNACIVMMNIGVCYAELR